ncbi:macro domain-containing protein [Aporhodopirellula aestuarii]|uniref:Macro domain-containing protein n=1 Tax=Aporhodopirellula aestuarii TaxID=2950107 RepID=A0ABT0TZN5_9BACT|nr:macro domain-containing protein [Aporhodopirellula aestuarii]MCM2370066.1 macro domain-containing protein [Aporhodopirellula aestuarii]
MATPIESRIRLFLGDITSLDCDAIVTAANEALRGGGGVDGAVHSAAGPELVRASMALAPCPAGEARITDGFNLAAKFVIHAVGPIFHDIETDRETLANAYTSSLSLAAENNAASVAFPCISTGVFGFPPDSACEIAIDAVVNWLRAHDQPEWVTFCCFQSDDHRRYKERLTELRLLS